MSKTLLQGATGNAEPRGCTQGKLPMGELEKSSGKRAAWAARQALQGWKPADSCPFSLSLHLGSACPGWPLACPEDRSSRCCGRQWMGGPLSEVCVTGASLAVPPAQLSKHRSFHCYVTTEMCVRMGHRPWLMAALWKWPAPRLSPLSLSLGQGTQFGRNDCQCWGCVTLR